MTGIRAARAVRATRSAARKALIKVSYACNNQCVFCHTHNLRHLDSRDGASVQAKIERAAALDCDMVVFSGGEPTLRRELAGWGAAGRDLGMSFGLVTNGRMLSYAAVTDRLLGLGLRYVHLSLHAPIPTLHDAIVRATAFEQSLGAIGLLSRADVRLVVNTVVTQHNLDELCGLVDLLAPFGGLALKLSFVEPKGEAAQRFDELVPPATIAGARIREAIDYASAKAPQLEVAHEGMPLCLVPGCEDQASGLSDHGFVYMSEVDEADLVVVDDRNKAHPSRCDGCSWRQRCPGLFRGYLERVGDEELQPVGND